MHIQRSTHPLFETGFIDSNVPLLETDFEPFESDELADELGFGKSYADER
jgi:hypothetical protein